MAVQERINFKSFRDNFDTEEKCREYLFKLRWFNGFECPKCGCKEFYLISSRNHYQCKSCEYQASVTAQTIMHRTHLPLTVWFWAIYLISRDKRGCSAQQLSNELEIGYKTAWFLSHRIRKAMGNRDQKYILAGVVELDDCYFGAAKKGQKRGRGTSKNKVIVAVSKDEDGHPAFVKMKVVANLKGTTIANFAKVNINESATVETDAYRSYRKPLKEKYLHNYSVFDSDSQSLNWLHRIIGNAKSFVEGTYHGLAKKYLQFYLDEFSYRFNRRFNRCEIFSRLLTAVIAANHFPLSELRG